MRLIDADALAIRFRRAIGTFVPNDSTRHMKTEDRLRCEGWQQGLTAIQDAPTIKPKKGKWMFVSPVTIKCDQCGCVVKGVGKDHWNWRGFNFCFNCGADMREVIE